jgi:2-phospho-L-lactate guanylyltransferase
MSRWTIVPSRGLASGKSRLAGLLDADRREALNGLLLRTVLAAVAGAEGGLSRCIVAAGADDASQLARSCGANVFFDPPDQGLNAAMEAARERAISCGASVILALVADLPNATGAALTRLFAAVPAGGAALVADKQGVGTTGLLLPAHCRLNFMFGDNSLARHRAALEDQGMEPIIWNDPALTFDLDTPGDYRHWRAQSCPPNVKAFSATLKESYGFDMGQ